MVRKSQSTPPDDDGQSAADHSLDLSADGTVPTVPFAGVAADSAVPTESAPHRRPWPLGWGWAIAAGFVAVVLVSGGTAFAVSALELSGDHQRLTSAAGALTTKGSTAKVKAATGKRLVVRGTIASIDADTVVVTTPAGVQRRLLLTGATRYGTKQRVETAGEFTVGTRVVAVVARSAADGELSVQRIALAAQRTGARPGAASTAAPSSTS